MYLDPWWLGSIPSPAWVLFLWCCLGPLREKFFLFLWKQYGMRTQFLGILQPFHHHEGNNEDESWDWLANPREIQTIIARVLLKPYYKNNVQFLQLDNCVFSFNGKLVLVTQSCLTLCDPMDCSPPDSSVHGRLQARILEWIAISFSTGHRSVSNHWPHGRVTESFHFYLSMLQLTEIYFSCNSLNSWGKILCVGLIRITRLQFSK